MSSLVSATVVVVVLLVGGPVLAAFPTAALGGLVIYAAVGLVDLGEFRRFARLRRTELLAALCDEAGRRCIVVALAHAKHDLLDDLDRVGLLARIGEEHIFPTNPTAVAAFRLAEARE